MAFDVATITGYVNENTDTLLTRSLFTPRTAQLMVDEGTLMVGVKSSEKINMLDTDAIFQSGDGCTRVSSGTTTLTNRTITVGAVAVIEDICVKTLRTTVWAKKLSAGSRENALPFEQEYAELKSGTIADQLEIAIWQGDTTSGNANLKRFDGFIKIIDAASGVVEANATPFVTAPIAGGTGITVGNVMSIVNAMWLALPARIAGKEDVRVFCGWDTFNKEIVALTNANMFNYAATGNEVKAENGEIVIPGTFYKLTAVHGLDGTNRLFAGRMKNFVLATDMQGEDERYELTPDQFNDYLRFHVEFKYGVNIAFPNEVVKFTLT